MIAKCAIDFMKKIGLILLPFMLIPLGSKAQNYIPLLDVAREWHLTSCFSGCLTDVYYINSDTTIQGVNYKVLDGFHYISRTFLFREELATQKVFLSYPAGGKGNEEVLLYDFSLRVGDSFNMKNPITPFPAEGGVFMLDSIVPKMLLDGLNHRFYYFSPGPNNSNFQLPIWVEGFGSLSLINAPGGTPDVLGAGKISCHFRNGALVYSQLDSLSACTPINVNINDADRSPLYIYPTSVSDKLHIKGANDFVAIKIYDVKGRLMLAQNLDKTDNEVQPLSTTFMPSGLYFLHLEGVKQVPQTFKFVKL